MENNNLDSITFAHINPFSCDSYMNQFQCNSFTKFSNLLAMLRSICAADIWLTKKNKIKRDRFSVALYATEEGSPELWSNRTW